MRSVTSRPVSQRLGVTLTLLTLWLLSMPMLGFASESITQRGAPIAEFLDAQGRLRMPEGYSGSLDPNGYRMLTQAGQAPTFVADTAPVPRLAQSGQWTGFGGVRDGCNGPIYAVARMPNGDLVVAGEFTSCADTLANNIAIYQFASNTWVSVGRGVYGSAYALVVSGNDLYVGGSFTDAGDVVALNVARWNGSAWTSLGAGSVNGLDNAVYALAIRGSDLYVGGSFTQAGGAPANHVALWNGNNWASLGVATSNGVNSRVNALAVSGGDLYAGGEFNQAGGVPANRVARWDGSVWGSLGSGIDNGANYSGVNALAVSGGDLFVGGSFTRAGGFPINNVALWHNNGWIGLGGGNSNGVAGVVRSLAASGNDLYVGGDVFSAGGIPVKYVAHWTGNGWVGLGSGVNSNTIYALLLSDNSLYAGGSFTQAGGATAHRMARWNGVTWSPLAGGFGQGVNGRIFALAVSGGNTYVAGEFTQAGGVGANRVACWNGSTWTNLGSGIGDRSYDSVNNFAIFGNDLYVGGSFQLAGGVSANNIARWNGSSWASLGNGVGNGVSVNGQVRALAVSGSDLYVGGGFSEAGGLVANQIARWNGSAWASLGTGSGNGLNGSVNALKTSGSDLYVGGNFTQAGGASANNVAQWNGSSWSSLGSGIGDGVIFSYVAALAIAGSDLYVGGKFTRAGGLMANRVARWNGSVWSSLGSGVANGVDGDVRALTLSGGNLYVGGEFIRAGGTSSFVNRLAVWNGSNWASLGTGNGNGLSGNPSYVSSLVSSGDGLYVGGEFGIAGGQLSVNVAKWQPETVFFSGFEGN